MKNHHQPLLPNRVYHLFSRAVGSEKIFLSDDNYRFFLKKLKQHTSPVCGLYAYALLPNHFHLLVKICTDEILTSQFEKTKNIPFHPLQHNLSDFVMERFSNFLNSYSKSFNKVNNRKGALFMDYLKRSVVNKDADFTNYIWYIHKNAIHHRLTKFPGEWPFDSYTSILSEAPTSLLRKEVIDWFGDNNAFIKFHQQPIYPKDITDIQ